MRMEMRFGGGKGDGESLWKEENGKMEKIYV